MLALHKAAGEGQGGAPRETGVSLEQLRFRYAVRGDSQYGRLHTFRVRGRRLQLLPLTHLRQARALGNSDKSWGELHRHWIKNTAGEIARVVGDSRSVRRQDRGQRVLKADVHPVHSGH
jgi:hypothetical protein